MIDGGLLYNSSYFYMCLKLSIIICKKYKVTVLLKGKCIFIITEASVSLKNNKSHMEMA